MRVMFEVLSICHSRAEQTLCKWNTLDGLGPPFRGSAIPEGRHSGGPPFRGPPFMGAAIPGSPIKCLPVVIQGHQATWMTKSMLLNYATDYLKSEALI